MLKRKICCRCKVYRVAEQFRRNARHSTGLRSRCRECESVPRKQWQQRYAEAHREQHRAKARRQFAEKRGTPELKAVQERAQARYRVRELICPELHMDLARKALGRFTGVSPQDREDLHSAGLLELVKASIEFDPRKGVPFRVFALQKIGRGMLDELRRLKRFRREQQFEEDERIAA